MKKGVPTLYVQFSKDLYRILRAALLFYKKLRKEPKNMGFENNLYNPSMANTMVNGAQCTVRWYVNDLKVSHVTKVVATAFSLKLVDLYNWRGP